MSGAVDFWCRHGADVLGRSLDGVVEEANAHRKKAIHLHPDHHKVVIVRRKPSCGNRTKGVIRLALVHSAKSFQSCDFDQKCRQTAGFLEPKAGG